MAVSFDKLRLVPTRSKNLIFGFVHETEKELSMTIPDLITTICIFYYYQFEYFTVCGPRIEIGESGNVASFVMDDSICMKDSDTSNSIYGCVSVESNDFVKYIWEFKIHQFSKFGDIYIGIDSTNKKWINLDFSEWDDPENGIYYAWGTDGQKYTNNEGNDTEERTEAVIQQGNIIRMELDVTARTLTYYKNGRVTDAKFNNLLLKDHVYHLAIALASKGTSVELINFEAV